VTSVERTLFDLCDPRLVTEAIAKGLTSLSALSEFVDRKRGVPGVQRFARAISLPQYRSKFERDFHRWLRRRGFPEPEVNDKVGRRRSMGRTSDLGGTRRTLRPRSGLYLPRATATSGPRP